MWAEEKMSEDEEEENMKAAEQGNVEAVLWINTENKRERLMKLS